MKKEYTIAWVLWLGAFLAIEVLALLNNDPGADTLSEHVWLAVQTPLAWWLLAGFLVWLTIHFLFRGKYDDPRKWFK
jgi:hypothetical protein